ncbi:MAG: energy-coupled thiamine transporter ThiT [Lachnospiraceae bacterium]|nr:energy-coupled thiamine transporter ThiT [Candidatus Darwinimomas equi]
MSVKKLVVCAMCVALAVVTNLIRIYTFPFGGSITLFSMLFIMLPAWLYGIREGVIAGLIFGILQFIIEPYFLSFIQFFLDYILAFSIMGLAGTVRNKKNGLVTGYIISVTARWVVATFAGLAWFSAGMTLDIWKEWSPLPYSMVYNAIYIYAEAAVTVIILLIPAVRKALDHVKSSLTS